MNYKFVTAALVVASIYFVGMFALPLIEPDEGRYNSIPWEMLQSGDFVVPTLNGVPYLEKPPLQYWLTAGVFAITGPTPWAGRLWPTLFALLTGLALFLFIRREVDERSGIVASLVFLSSLYTLVLSRVSILDIPFGFFVTVSLFCAYRFLKSGDRSALYALWIAAALGFMTKGLAAIVLPTGGIVVYCVFSRRYFAWVSLLSPLPIIVFAAITLPWLIAVEMKLPGALNFFIIHEHFSRFATNVHHREGPLYYYAPIIILGLVPWVGWMFGRFWRDYSKYRNVVLFLAIAAGFVILFFSVSSSKLETYLTPIWAALCGLIGISIAQRGDNDFRAGLAAAIPCWLVALTFVAYPYVLVNQYSSAAIGSVDELAIAPAAAFAAGAGFVALRRQKLLKSALFTAILMSAALVSFAFPAGEMLGKIKGSQGIAAVVSDQLMLEDELARYSVELQGLYMLTGRRFVVIESPGELDFGCHTLSQEEQSQWFPTKDEFALRWRGARRILTVMRRDKLEQFRDDFGDCDLAGSYGRFIVVENKPRALR